ncbi:MAG: hypothetical protein V5A25_07490 [Halovenus sp.]
MEHAETAQGESVVSTRGRPVIGGTVSPCVMTRDRDGRRERAVRIVNVEVAIR